MGPFFIKKKKKPEFGSLSLPEWYLYCSRFVSTCHKLAGNFGILVFLFVGKEEKPKDKNQKTVRKKTVRKKTVRKKTVRKKPFGKKPFS